MKPDTGAFVRTKQAEQKSHHDQHSRYRSLDPGQAVMVKDFRCNKWISGVIISKLGPVTYTVQVEGAIWKRHIDQLAERTSTPPVNSIQDNFQCPNQPSDTQELPRQEDIRVRRYPQRGHRPPDRLTCM